MDDGLTAFLGSGFGRRVLTLVCYQFFLSIPAWIYLIMAPRFPRTRKIAEPHAMLVVDTVYTIIWLSAFATQAAYNAKGLCGTACNVSKAVVAMAVFVLCVLEPP